MEEQLERKMVVLSKAIAEQQSNIKNCLSTTFSSTIPMVDLSKPDAKTLIVKACEEFRFFKVINRGVPIQAIFELESEAFKFFSMPDNDKEKAGPPNPFRYSRNKIGHNGFIGFGEHTDPQIISLLRSNNTLGLQIYLRYGNWIQS